MAARGAGARLPLAALLALLALLGAASGSLLDSWQHTQVGRVTHAALVGPRAFVASAQGVVASLALRNGDVGAQPLTRRCAREAHARARARSARVLRPLTQPTPPYRRTEWRQVLEADDVLDDAVFLSKRVITLSGAGKFVRAWSAAVRAPAGVPLCRCSARFGARWALQAAGCKPSQRAVSFRA